jgi:tryptophan synthase beta chain
VIAEANDATAKGEDRVILFNYCGHGLLDLSAYEDHLAGTMPDEP